MKFSARKFLLVSVFAVLVYGALVLAGDVHKLKTVLGDYAWWTFGASLVLAFLNYVFRFGKWEYYLRRLDVGSHQPGQAYEALPTLESFVIFVAGFAMSITPGKAGEVFKSALLASARGAPVALTAPIVIADRLTDLLALVLLVGLGSASFPGYGLLAVSALLLVAVALVFVFAEGLSLRIFAWIEAQRWGAKLGSKLREAYASLRVVASPQALLAMTAVSVVAWALECAALWLILRGLAAPVSVPLAFFAYATATIAGALAMLPGGVGGTELTMRTILTHTGQLPQSVADAATLLTRLATLWFAVILGALAVLAFRRLYDRKRNVLLSAVPPEPKQA